MPTTSAEMVRDFHKAVGAPAPAIPRVPEDDRILLRLTLIAEEVAEVDPQLVVHSKNGEVTAVHYEQINNMLLNEFLKEHKKVQDLEVTVARQQKGMEVLTAQLQEQAAQIQKVSAQLEMSEPAAKVVVNKP